MNMRSPSAAVLHQPPRGAAERGRAHRLDLWRLRGQAARAAHQPRQVPPAPRSTDPELRDEIEAAWLAGYDGRNGGK
ncbi:hypothetical protein FFI89_018890 [Bradyrhizobium sp. KBS0727]|uniref:hypothetical protein n=1 Tax=unclassified Bradyrhizobium TaxID=2631580 RepID=UPI00110DABE6|nr:MULTISPECIES: hypothetical protein [unclassified Bradyrhizobium]QDW39033.1 hypothetical protein FFI71_018890 [Bradyrhizobium sp. KBS0725]QDW45636.1 hypothetical protein FFI89_018890 [Bradyrhizobium sp. KBS0727]